MNKRVAAIVVVIGLLLGGAYYGSPYWAVHQMQAAARAGEGDRLAGYIDLPAVRESIKTQLQTMMMKKMQSDDMKGNPFAAMGMMLAGGMVNMLVDGMVTPESVANMVNSGKPKPPAMVETPPPKTELAGDSDKHPRIERHYEGVGVFKVEMYDPQTDATTLTLVLNRENWFDWKLKAVRFPALADTGFEPSGTDQRTADRIAAANIEIDQLGQAIELFKLETGRYPTTSEGLLALIQAPSGMSNWNGPYWKRSTVPKDPWGNEYQYSSPGANGPFNVISYGADGKEGGDGPNQDITSLH